MLAAIAFSVAVGFGIVAPVLPLFARQFGVGNTAAGAVVSVFAFLRLVSGPGVGRLVNRLGERLTLFTGLAIVAFSSLLAGLAQSYLQLLVLRGAGGVGSAMFTVSAYSLLLRVVASHQRGRATGWFQSGFLIGGISGPLFGGALSAISLRAPFFVYAGTLGVAAAISLLALRRADGDDVGAGDGMRAPTGVREALAHPAYRAALLSNFSTGWVIFGIRSSLIPLFVADALGRDAIWVGIGFVVGGLVQAATLWLAGRMVDRVGRRPAMITGSVLATVGIAMLALLATLPGFLLAMAVIGLAGSFLGVAPAATVGDVVHGRGGTVIAVFQMASDAGAIVGPLVAGWLADGVSYGAAFGVAAAISAAAVALAIRMPETRQPPSTAVAGR